MKADEIIENLRFNQGKFEKKSVIEARKIKEEISEKLLEELENVANNVTNYAQQDTYILHFYAMYLLAEFREKRAFPIIIKLISQNQTDVDTLLGDLLTEGLPSILASTYDGNIQSLYNVISNTKLNEYARASAFEALEILCEYDIINKEQIMDMIEKMLAGELKNDDSIVITHFVTFISNNKFLSKIELVNDLYKSDRVDEMSIGGYDKFIDNIYGGKDYYQNLKMIDNTVESLSHWACFNNVDNDSDEEHFSEEKFEDLIHDLKKYENKKISEATSVKVGRNDPCPCGSGKKYKKCCINKVEKKVVTPADYYIQESLKNYPREELQKHYDDEVIQIDEKLYKAFKHKAVPLFVQRNYVEEARQNIQNVEEALQLIQEKCEKENITSIEDFDKKISIHYNFNDIIHSYLKILDGRGVSDKDCKNKKLAFMEQLTNIFKLDDTYIEFLISSIVDDYLYLDNHTSAEEIINKFKDIFPEHEILLNIKLAEAYLEDDEDFETILQPITQSIEKYGKNDVLEIKEIEIYYEYAYPIYFEEESEMDMEHELKLHTKFWQLVKDFIANHNIESEKEFDSKIEPEYSYYNILNRINNFYGVNENYKEERFSFLNEALSLIDMDSYTKGLIIDGFAGYYSSEGNIDKAVKIADDFINENPNSSNAILIKSNIYSNLETPDYERSISIVKDALDCGKCADKYALLSKLAILYDLSGDKDEAKKYQRLVI